MNLHELVAALDELLDADAIPDYGPNGLQVEGRATVKRVVTAVSASRALFAAAIARRADAILVHHGILWNGPEPPRLVGSLGERVRLLLVNDISLLAYHLPLDRHPELGNSARLARALGLGELAPFGEHRGAVIGVRGVFPTPHHPEELAAALAEACQQPPLHFPGAPSRITSVGIVTGAAPREYHQAVAADLDAYITGEASEWVMHQAAEDGVHFFAAGHYATERFGVVALGDWLEQRYGLEVEFIDLPNPV